MRFRFWWLLSLVAFVVCWSPAVAFASEATLSVGEEFSVTARSSEATQARIRVWTEGIDYEAVCSSAPDQFGVYDAVWDNGALSIVYDYFGVSSIERGRFLVPSVSVDGQVLPTRLSIEIDVPDGTEPHLLAVGDRPPSYYGGSLASYPAAVLSGDTTEPVSSRPDGVPLGYQASRSGSKVFIEAVAGDVEDGTICFSMCEVEEEDVVEEAPQPVGGEGIPKGETVEEAEEVSAKNEKEEDGPDTPVAVIGGGGSEGLVIRGALILLAILMAGSMIKS